MLGANKVMIGLFPHLWFKNYTKWYNTIRYKMLIPSIRWKTSKKAKGKRQK